MERIQKELHASMQANGIETRRLVMATKYSQMAVNIEDTKLNQYLTVMVFTCGLQSIKVLDLSIMANGSMER